MFFRDIGIHYVSLSWRNLLENYKLAGKTLCKTNTAPIPYQNERRIIQSKRQMECVYRRRHQNAGAVNRPLRELRVIERNRTTMVEMENDIGGSFFKSAIKEELETGLTKSMVCRQ